MEGLIVMFGIVIIGGIITALIFHAQETHQQPTQVK